MPAPLRPQARPTRLLLRPLKPRRTHRLRHLRPQLRLRRGPSGKEAAQPLPPWFQRAEFWHGWLQFRLPIGCRFCQNWDIAKARSFDRLGVEASPEKIAQVAADRGIDSVAFTYNDPIVFAEYAIDTAEACRALGIHPIAVTAGYMSAEARPDFYAAMDAANIDLKGFTEEFYWRVTGTHLADVLETIDYAVNEARTPEGEHVWVELTTLLIPGFNDDDAQLHAECTWIREHLGPDVPLHFSAFHPSYRMMDVPPTPHETLTRARDIALEEGLNYVYTGNVHDREGDTTYCPNPECRAKLVERDWYRIIANRLSAGYGGNGHCPVCRTAIAGRW